MALTDNIVSYWKLDGNSTDSHGSNNGTDTSITYSAGNGKIVQGGGFNGTTSLIYSQSASFDFFGTANLTQSFWIKVSSLGIAGNFYGISMIQEGTNVTIYDKGIQLLNNGSILFYGYDGAVKKATSATGVIVVGTWYHITGTYDGTNLKIYVDGDLKATTACSSTYNFTNPRLVFSHVTTVGGNNKFFNGAIDEVGLWSRALSAAEVTSLYNAGVGLAYPFTGNTTNFFQFM